MTATAGGGPAAVHTVLATKVGELTVVREGGSLTGLYFPRHWPRPDRSAFGVRGDEGFEEAARQLGEFLAGDRSAFDLPLKIVLHDIFAVPFDDIAAIVGRSPAAARQLASRARRRVQGIAPGPGTDLARQRAITDAFLAAARSGNFGALMETLDPDAVVRSNGTEVVRGAAAVAGRAFLFTRTAKVILPAVINGGAGLVTATDGRPVTLVGFTITNTKITAIDLIDDPHRIAEANLAILGRARPPAPYPLLARTGPQHHEQRHRIR